MKTKPILILSLIITFFISCSSNDDSPGSFSNTNGLEINGELQNDATTIAFLNDLGTVEGEEDGYALSLITTLSNDAVVNLIFYNNDENAENLILGDYFTDLDFASSNDEYKYVYASVINYNSEHFISIDDNYNDDIVVLSKCNKSSELASGEYEVTLTNSGKTETLHIKGSFNNQHMVVSE